MIKVESKLVSRAFTGKRSIQGVLLAVLWMNVLDADLVRKANDRPNLGYASRRGRSRPDSPSSSHMAIPSSPISNCCWPMPKSPLVCGSLHLKHLDGQTDGCSTVRIEGGRATERILIHTTNTQNTDRPTDR